MKRGRQGASQHAKVSVSKSVKGIVDWTARQAYAAALTQGTVAHPCSVERPAILAVSGGFQALARLNSGARTADYIRGVIADYLIRRQGVPGRGDRRSAR